MVKHRLENTLHELSTDVHIFHPKVKSSTIILFESKMMNITFELSRTDLTILMLLTDYSLIGIIPFSDNLPLGW